MIEIRMNITFILPGGNKLQELLDIIFENAKY